MAPEQQVSESHPPVGFCEHVNFVTFLLICRYCFDEGQRGSGIWEIKWELLLHIAVKPKTSIRHQRKSGF